MAIGCYFVHEGFTPERYAEAIRRLEDSGAGAPEGRRYHVALESEGEISVFDIWESKEALDAFAATLVPILSDVGVGLKEPTVARVHNVIEGHLATT